jgi:hypothetical protein
LPWSRPTHTVVRPDSSLVPVLTLMLRHVSPDQLPCAISDARPELRVLPAVNGAGEDRLRAGRDVDPAHVLAADLTEGDPRQRKRRTTEVGVQELGQEQLVAVSVGLAKGPNSRAPGRARDRCRRRR